AGGVGCQADELLDRPLGTGRGTSDELVGHQEDEGEPAGGGELADHEGGEDGDGREGGGRGLAVAELDPRGPEERDGEEDRGDDRGDLGDLGADPGPTGDPGGGEEDAADQVEEDGALAL